MNREIHVRICERLGVKFPGATRPRGETPRAYSPGGAVPLGGGSEGSASADRVGDEPARFDAASREDALVDLRRGKESFVFLGLLDPGPGMGFFTLELARMVGEPGRVIAVDIQPRMLAALRRRAARGGAGGRLDTRLATSDSLGVGDLAGKVDFTLAFAVVHELPSASRFFREVAEASKPGGQLLLAEPAGHVSDSEFAAELRAAADAGFRVLASPALRRSRTALLEKS